MSNRHAAMIRNAKTIGQVSRSKEVNERERERENREKKMMPICVTAARRKSDRAYKCERRSIGHKPNYRSIGSHRYRSFTVKKKSKKKIRE